MYKSVRPAKSSGFGTYRSFVKQSFRKGFEIPLLPYQTNGILSKQLWQSKNHVLRIIPGYDVDTGEVYPQNINCNEFASDSDFTDYLSDTFVLAYIATGIGPNYEMLITDYAPGSADESKYAGNTVLRTFLRNVLYACRDKDSKEKKKHKARFGVTPTVQRWVGDGQRDSIVHFAKEAILMQALMFQINGKQNTDADDKPLVDEDGDIRPLLGVVAIDHKKSQAELLRALVEPANPGLPLDPRTNNKYGPMAECHGNQLFLNTMRDQDDKNMLRVSVQEPGKGWTPTPYDLTEDQVRELWHPWNELLDYMTAEEQLKYLASRFDACAVNYYVGTDPILRDLSIPEEIAAAGYGEFSQFTDGVKEVAQKVTLQKASAGLGKRPGLKLGGSKSVQQAAEEDPERPEYDDEDDEQEPVEEAKPKLGAAKKLGLTAASSAKASAVTAQLQKMRQSGVKLPQSSEDQISDRANALLNADVELPEGYSEDEEDAETQN